MFNVVSSTTLDRNVNKNANQMIDGYTASAAARGMTCLSANTSPP